MQITVKVSFPVLVFGWDKQYGASEDITILPGQKVFAPGPPIPDSTAYANLPGTITCYEGADDGKRFHVSRGNPLQYGNEKRKVVIRHYKDPRPEIT